MVIGGGFRDLGGEGPPTGGDTSQRPSLRPKGPGSVSPISKPVSSGPNSAPVSTPAPASQASAMPYGQAKDPGAYGTPGAPSSSPLGEWQSWLNTMGPYLAQLPNAQPMAESGGLSSLAASPVGPGLVGYGGGMNTDWQNNSRGFRAMIQ